MLTLILIGSRGRRGSRTVMANSLRSARSGGHQVQTERAFHRAWSKGDETALETLTPLVHGELHQRTRGLMGRERMDHSLQPTALIDEAYLRLVAKPGFDEK